MVCTDEDVLFPNYIFDGLAGKGAFSVVKKAMDTRTGCLVAVKMISLKILQGNKVAEDQVEREITIMRKLMNPYVIQLYDVVYTPSHVCLIMEYASKGDFFDYVASRKSLEEAEARPFFRQLIAGLEYCHGKMVAHRDLKLGNLLLDENLNLKITDFGLSAFMNDSNMLNESCGSPHYAAPEVLSGEQ